MACQVGSLQCSVGFLQSPVGGAHGRRNGLRERVVLRPEGPEVRVMSDGLQRLLGQRLSGVSILSGRYADGERPKGYSEFRNAFSGDIKLEEVNAKGKLLYWKLTDDRCIYFTLGMTGYFGWMENAHSRLQFDFDRKEPSSVFFNDQRNFGTVSFTMSVSELEEKLLKIGDSFLDGLTEDRFLEILEKQRKSKRDRSLVVFLMDQSKTSGVGNYILAESLYQSRIHPWASVGDLKDEECVELYRSIRDVIVGSYGVQKDNPFRRTNIDSILKVYGRKEDPEGRPVVRAEGPHKRSIWYVPDVQVKGKQ